MRTDVFIVIISIYRRAHFGRIGDGCRILTATRDSTRLSLSPLPEVLFAVVVVVVVGCQDCHLLSEVYDCAVSMAMNGKVNMVLNIHRNHKAY